MPSLSRSTSVQSTAVLSFQLVSNCVPLQSSIVHELRNGMNYASKYGISDENLPSNTFFKDWNRSSRGNQDGFTNCSSQGGCALTACITRTCQKACFALQSPVHSVYPYIKWQTTRSTCSRTGVWHYKTKLYKEEQRSTCTVCREPVLGTYSAEYVPSPLLRTLTSMLL